MTYLTKRPKKGIPSRPAVQRLGPGNRWVPEPKQEDEEEETRDLTDYFRELFNIGRHKRPGGDDEPKGS
jgi:hypothetical protein